MDKVIKGIVLNNGSLLIAEIEELFVGPDEPDCRLLNAYTYNNGNYEKWPSFSAQEDVVIKSSNILTIVELSENVRDEYFKLPVE
jgi:hypothetical protein